MLSQFHGQLVGLHRSRDDLICCFSNETSKSAFIVDFEKNKKTLELIMYIVKKIFFEYVQIFYQSFYKSHITVI